jgi:hypothetical protein
VVDEELIAAVGNESTHCARILIAKQRVPLAGLLCREPRFCVGIDFAECRHAVSMVVPSAVLGALAVPIELHNHACVGQRLERVPHELSV